jgi:hypothetical protein
VPLLAASEPEACCAGPVADPRSLPSPTSTPPGTRQLVVDHYDQRGRLDPWSETPNPNFNETDDISCSATRVVESTTRETNYRGDWNRTAGYGVYG